ncbi:hypothetical protein [Streptomyces sp. ALI-76-A]|uniref:hypothetical protein n=1 Tax=Streptomyces sp. ALI-76-A TaxID=3025736 RepID=UPI00256EF28B|nr:hypothetical protein [Streptomyces sp. ALI-76-A]MDL5206685.1 hypothetical protein [Streptomyces sp. ALI-76-A]
MKTNLLHEDPCPLCGQPLTLRPHVVVRSAGVPYPTRTDYLPHCTRCTNDPVIEQKWNDLMNDRGGS